MIALPRHLHTAQTMQPGHYTTETLHGEIAIACPDCGHTSELEQTPLADGTVPLLWACPYAHCTYQGQLRLVDWGEAVLT